MSTDTVVNFFNGKSVFLTGGSGFIGKVLIEKLLRACPDIQRIYLLMRPSKDGKNPQQRLHELLQSRVFQFSKQKLNLDRLTVVCGDITVEGLGLSDSDRQMLVENVSVVIHSAATVRFYGPLKNFILHNVLGTDYIMTLSRQMKKLMSIVYVSTAYANCNLIEIQEKVYPLGASAQSLIDRILLDNSDDTPPVGHPSLLGRPNSYTLSKAIAESLIQEKYSDLPITICRPSIVAHAYKDPIEGWCDSFNGVAGTLLLGGLGIARTMEIHCEFKADIIPVDFVANSLIVVAYHTARNPTERRRVIHLTSGVENPVTWGQILDQVRISATRSPSINLVRPVANNPICPTTRLAKLHVFLIKLFSHFIFAYCFDIFRVLTLRKPLLVQVTKRMHRAFDVLEHFTNLEWQFVYGNYNKIFNQLNSTEQILFESNVSTIDWAQYCDSLYMGSRRYLLNEDDSTVELGKKRQKRIEIYFVILKLFWYLLIFGLIYFIFYR